MKKYVYIDDCWPARGLFAFYWCVMDVLRTIDRPDCGLFVELSKKTLYYDPNYTKTDNVWEYYFEQPSNIQLDETCEKIHYTAERAKKLIFGLTNGRYAMQESQSIIELGKHLTKKYTRFKQHIIEKAEKFETKNFKGKKILGVHVRGGAHFTTGHARGQGLPLEYYYQKVDEHLPEYDSVFLITPDMPTRNAFADRYRSNLLHYDSDVISKQWGMEAEVQNMDRNYEKGETAILECILLSRCNKMLLTGSNLGCLSMVLKDDSSSYEFIDKHVRYS
ncbi:MAG: hypothetical protein KKB59_19720 [Spirochaetes bacterium]|nr:hypothetical protein [Spirochaetota bacterium]